MQRQVPHKPVPVDWASNLVSGTIAVLSATSIYLSARRELGAALAAIADEPAVERETYYYLAHIGSITAIDDFLADRRLVAYAMTAHGLGAMTYATAFIRKLLEGGIADSGALVNRLVDARYRTFVADFDFHRHGAATTSLERAQARIVELYRRQILEENVARQSEGARLALYFERKAAALDGWSDVLADAALLKVVQTALGVSPQMSNLAIDAQKKMLESRFDIADLRDPRKRHGFIERFTARYDAQNPATAARASPVPAATFAAPARGAQLFNAIEKLR